MKKNKQKLKEFNVYIDIAESIEVKAYTKEEAIDKAIELLNNNNTTWSVDDAELMAEEYIE